MLSQIALCLVLSCHQHRCQCHAHIEQPKGSLMPKLPYIQELHRYMAEARPDLCRAGELRDPLSNMLIKRGLNIMTSSQRLHDNINNLKCLRDHEHQTIEGTTRWQGKTVLRSRYSESYPRKFSRLVAKSLLKVHFPYEKPIGSTHWFCLIRCTVMHWQPP